MKLATSANGTSCHFAATQHFGRFRSEPELRQEAKPADSVEN
jgi:hypothetical protein